MAARELAIGRLGKKKDCVLFFFPPPNRRLSCCHTLALPPKKNTRSQVKSVLSQSTLKAVSEAFNTNDIHDLYIWITSLFETLGSIPLVSIIREVQLHIKKILVPGYLSSLCIFNKGILN